MRRFDLVLIAAILLTWGIGYYVFNKNDKAQASAIKHLETSNDSINKLLSIERYHISKKEDTVRMLKAYIKGIEGDRLRQEQKLKEVNTRFEQLQIKYRYRTLKTLDSLRWAWYPDSITVATRRQFIPQQ